jgi:hypothetical protein
MMELGHDPPSATFPYADYPFAGDDLWIDRTRTGNVQIAWRKGNPRQGRWLSYLRPDGVLLSSEMGRKWTGTWKIQSNKLCMSNPNLESPDCNEVWMSGANIRLRENQNQETFDATVEKHRAN